MKVEKWGDELAIRLSDEVVALMDLEEGHDVDIRVVGTDAIEIARTRGSERTVVHLRNSPGPRGSEEGDRASGID